MLKKTISYEDFNGVEVKEDFYFKLTKAELMEMEATTPGGMSNLIQRVVDSQDGPTIFKIFKELIMKSYGVKSDDGKRHIKSRELSEAFIQTEAYSNLLMELLEDSEAAANFVKGILPKQK